MADDEGRKPEDENSDDQTDGDDTDTDGEDEDPWTPPTREEFEKLVKRSRANAKEAADRRKYLASHGIDHKTGKRLGGDDEDGEDTAPPVSGQPPAQPAGPSRAELKLQAQLKSVTEDSNRVLRAAVRSELAAAGLKGPLAKLAASQIDLGEITVSDDGTLDGLDEQVDQIKEDLLAEYPNLFTPTPTPRSRPTKNAAETTRRDKDTKPPSFGEALMKSIGR